MVQRPLICILMKKKAADSLFFTKKLYFSYKSVFVGGVLRQDDRLIPAGIPLQFMYGVLDRNICIRADNAKFFINLIESQDRSSFFRIIEYTCCKQ